MEITLQQVGRPLSTGKTFENRTEMVKRHNVSEKTYNKRIKHGWSRTAALCSYVTK